MESYVERIKASAENLAKDVFPAKALELDTIINVYIYIWKHSLFKTIRI